ncbi:IPT/TIG domain-containing protein [Streptomyces sp. Isolate_219]|uniref:IPT/TIG domain-containing protein n=1 Tax=Streptomyces sp. Isolate_219 TaxID=2950110 RepID=UPI0021C96531|nr:IPT/TIG domain-containing protein [Streptomyces sp. Isolate_219]
MFAFTPHIPAPAQARDPGLFAAFVAGAVIPVGVLPQGITLSPDGARAYVANRGSDTVSVIDTVTDTVTATIPTGAGPSFVGISPDGTRGYVTVADDGLVSVVDTATNAIVANVPVGEGPTMAAVTPDGTRVYVTQQAGTTVSVIDAATNTVTDTVPVGAGGTGVVITPDGTRAYVACFSGSVSVIDTATNTVTTTITAGDVPILLALTPDGARLYVTNAGSSTVSVVDTATNAVIATVGVSAQPRFLAVSPDGAHVYVANSLPDTVSVIDTATHTVVENIGVGAGPTGLTVFPDGTHAYVVNAEANTVSVIATTVIPDQGSTGGGDSVTVTGHHLANATAVRFGAAQAAVTANTDTSLTVTSPAGGGVVPVTVTTPGGTGFLGTFYYVPLPALTGISPAAGPVGGSDDEIVITGRNLSGAIDVYFGSTRAVIQSVSDAQVTVRAAGAPGPGGVAVTVITAGGSAGGLTYTYVNQPTVTGISPNTGPTSGGTVVTITGTDLTYTDQVTFNGVLAPFEVISDTSVIATSPPSGAAGTVDVTVTGPDGSTPTTGFTYVDDPDI